MANIKQPRFNSTTLWYALSDANFLLFLDQFQSVCSTYQTALGVSDGELEEIQEAWTAYGDTLKAAIQARAAAEAATEVKNQQRGATTDVIRKFVAEFQADPNIPEEVYGLLEIPKRGTRGQRGAAQTPTNVIAMPGGLGEVKLSFNRNTNPKSAVFTVQELRGTTWINVASGTRTRYTLTGYPAGTEVQFRVFATRGESVSAPSNTVVVWGNGNIGNAKLEVAA